jgi:hypothetical protein
MIRRIRFLLASACLIATLSACHQQQKAGHGEVSGQILPGSVSDAMLPYDAVKSKPPLAPREADGQGDNAAGDNAADSADKAGSSDSAAPEVAASPSPVAPAAAN